MAGMLVKCLSWIGENNLTICLDTIMRVPGLFLIEFWYDTLKEDGFFVQMYEGFAFEDGGPAPESVVLSLASLLLVSISSYERFRLRFHSPSF